MLEERTPETIARAHTLVMAHGWNTTSYQVLNPGFRYWFDPAGDAVAGVVPTGRVWVVGGAPVCSADRLAAVSKRLEAGARAAGAEVCYVAAQSRLEQIKRHDDSASLLYLGAEPCWDPRSWPQILAAHSSARAQVARSRNKGVVIEERRMRGDEALALLGGVQSEWLDEKGLPPLGFLTMPWLLDRLEDRRLFVATRGDAIVAFAVLTPVPGREGWLVEQLARLPSAPNGVGEQLIDAAFRQIATEGAAFASLGIVPLSRRADAPETAPWWLRGAFGWARAHGRRFYNFDGLDRFKAKLYPDDWLPVYAVLTAPTPTPALMWGVLEAVLGGPPLAFFAAAGARAVRSEWRTLWGKQKGP